MKSRVSLSSLQLLDMLEIEIEIEPVSLQASCTDLPSFKLLKPVLPSIVFILAKGCAGKKRADSVL